MKIKNICSMVLVSVAVMFSSCQDFLEPDMTESVNPKNFYKTETQIDQAMNGLYHVINNMPMYRWILGEVRSDNVWIEQDKVGGVYDIAYFKNTETVSNSHVLNAWKLYGSIIANANQILNKIDEVPFTDEAVKNHYKGELRFIRALAYFDYVRFFGNVPISTEPTTPEGVFSIHLSDTKTVYESLIVPDLEFAAENMLEVAKRYDGKTDVVVGRATKMAAKALLGEVYITMAGHPINDESKKELAKNLFKEVIDYSEANNNKWWAADMEAWNKMWLHEFNNKYFIFEIQCATDENSSQGNSMTSLTVDTWSGSYYGGQKNQLRGGSFGYPYVEPQLRKYLMQTNDNSEYIDQRCFNTVTVKDNNGKRIETNEFYYMKFWENKVKREALGYTALSLPNKNNIWPQDFPIIRYENVILYYAELLGKDEGLAYLNKTRTRAGLTAYTAADFASEEEYQEAVMEERRIEMASEGIRWFDLVRTNKWQEKLKAMFTTDAPDSPMPSLADYANNVLPFTYIYPIPQQQLQIREGLYDQNPGY